MAIDSGVLAPLTPLFGEWTTEAPTPMGPARCTRRFTRALGGAYVELVAEWRFASGGPGYEERAYFGAAKEGVLGFWSFTSDGGHATGEIADVAEVHAQALGFIAAMPAGRARQAYWTTPDGALQWVVEAETPTGWERVATHSYRRLTV